MFDKILSRSNVTYFMMFIVNPIIILCFQNCSVTKLSDQKVASQPIPISAPSNK